MHRRMRWECRPGPRLANRSVGQTLYFRFRHNARTFREARNRARLWTRKEVRDRSHRLRQRVRKLNKFFRHVSHLQQPDFTDVGASTFADGLDLDLEDRAVPVVADKITPRAFAIWRLKISPEKFRCTIGLGALNNYSLVRTKRRAWAHVLSSTVEVCR